MNQRAKSPISTDALDSEATGNPRFLSAIYLVLGLILVGSLVGIFIMATRISADTTYNSNRVDLANNQCSLSQQITKALLAFERDQNKGDTASSLKEIKETRETFNTVLKGFDSGAKIPGIDGKEMELQKSTDPEERRSVEEAKKIWQPLYTQLKRIETGDAVASEVTETVKTARAKNLQLLALMNSLTRQSD